MRASLRPEKPLFGFTARFPHAKRRIHLFADDQLVYFRPKNAPPDWWGAFVSWGNYLVETKQWKRVEREARTLLRHSHYCRVLHLRDPREDETRMWRVLWRPERGNATPVGHSDELHGTFFWPVPLRRSLWKTGTDELLTHFRREWHNPQSDVRIALPWCDWSLEERETRYSLDSRRFGNATKVGARWCATVAHLGWLAGMGYTKFARILSQLGQRRPTSWNRFSLNDLG